MAASPPILLTPGPLTTAPATREAMLRDWGSWDGEFNRMTASVCADLVRIAHGEEEYVCVPMQGSGTFSVEATLATLVPREGCVLVPGMGFVIVRRALLETCARRSPSLALDLHDQWAYMEKTMQWRFTPPTHVVAALRCALDAFAAQGGQRARGARYARNCATLIEGMKALGFRPFLPAEVQSNVIVTFHAPRDPAWRFADFYTAVREGGYILYPGKLTEVETFRVGCIGEIDDADMRGAVAAIARALEQLGIEVR